MSIEVLKWAWEQPCPNPTSKLVLMALADHANADGECWPSMKRIAEISGISARQVSNHIVELTRLGYVEKADRRRYGGQYRGWDYIVCYRRKPATTGSPLPVTSGSPATSPAEASFRSEPPENRQVEPPVVAPVSIRRDLMFEALCKATGANTERLTTSERGRINKALKELREVGATPDDILLRARHYRQRFPGAPVTANALASNWSLLEREPPPPRMPGTVDGVGNGGVFL